MAGWPRCKTAACQSFASLHAGADLVTRPHASGRSHSHGHGTGATIPSRWTIHRSLVLHRTKTGSIHGSGSPTGSGKKEKRSGSPATRWRALIPATNSGLFGGWGETRVLIGGRHGMCRQPQRAHYFDANLAGKRPTHHLAIELYG